jgi:excisionase family DNA binding protein
VNNETTSTKKLGANNQEAPPVSAEPTYVTGEAARVLGVSSSYVRKMIASGELATHRDEQGYHHIPQDAIHAKLEERGFAPPAGAASEDSGGIERTEEPRDDGLRGEEAGAARRELRRLGEEVRALRDELLPLIHLARSAQEDKESVLEEKVILEEERARLLAEIEEERQRANELADELETSRLKWWAQWIESRSETS